MRIKTATLMTAAASLALAGTASAVTVFEEDWEYAKTNADINVDAGLHDSIGYGLNTDNPNTTLNGGVGTGGNVRVDQSGFGGVYGTNTSAGTGVRVRSSNGAWLNRTALDLTPYTEVTFSFDVRQRTANYVQVIEYSEDQVFTNPILLDTLDGNSDFDVWVAKSYTLTDGVGGVNFTNDAYFRIRKLRPNPGGTNGGANSTFHVYDNLLIDGVPEPSSLALLGLGGLLIARRRRG